MRPDLVATGNIVVASILGSIAAAVACQRNGNLPVSPQEVTEKVDALERRATFS